MNTSLDNSIYQDLLINVFDFLDVNDLALCEQVSKKFYNLSNDDRVWKRILDSFRMINNTQLNNKTFFQKYSITKAENISKNFEKFSNNLNMCKNAMFECKIPLSLKSFVVDMLNTETKSKEIKNITLYFIKELNKEDYDKQIEEIQFHFHQTRSMGYLSLINLYKDLP